MDCRLEVSDSENDNIFPTDVYTYRNGSTKICAKGPNVNTTNVTGISFRNNTISSATQMSRHFERPTFIEPDIRNNALSSNMQMSRNFERSRFMETTLDQRSMYSRRETSPMSMYAGSELRSRNFHQSYYGPMSFQRSMCNGRNGSSMSTRSVDSNATVSATDIAFAIKNVEFNKSDWTIIKDAYNKRMKRRVRKKIEKRRNMGLFLKRCRRKSGYDSGEQGSDSSISSDECKSTSLALQKNLSSCRSTHTNISDIRQCIRDTNIYKDCSENLRNLGYKSKLRHSQSKLNNYMNVCLESAPTTKHSYSTQNGISLPQNSQMSQFQNDLPIQKPNKPITTNERDRLCIKKSTLQSKFPNETLARNNNCNTDFDSDNEEIFSNVTIRERSLNDIETNNNRKCESKRNLDNEHHQSPTKKKAKISKNCDFKFLKPQFPIKKSSTSRVKEQLISKSAAPLTDICAIPQIEIVNKNTEKHSKDNHVEETDELANDKVESQPDVLSHTENTNEVSMRPSFIKRKLYTQNMNVIENKISDGLNSSQSDVYSAIQREKHKARKLVTNQSCLNRDINQEDNNLLDLIHKIVPPDQMNITNVTNKTSLSSKTSLEKKNPDERWDVTSGISACNNDNVSDTYTDEEIFHNNTKKVNKPLSAKNAIDEQKKSTQHKVKSFWDTDFESDVDSNIERCTTLQKENRNQGINQCVSVVHNSSKRNMLNYSKSSVDKIKATRNPNTSVNRKAGLTKYNINRNLTISIPYTTTKTDSFTSQTNHVLNESINNNPLQPNVIESVNPKRNTTNDNIEPKKSTVKTVGKSVKADSKKNKTVSKIERVESHPVIGHVETKTKSDPLKSSKENLQDTSTKTKRTLTRKVKNDDKKMTLKDQDVNLDTSAKTADISKNLQTSKSTKGANNKQNKDNVDSEKILRSNRTPKKIDCCKDYDSFEQDSKARNNKSQETKIDRNVDSVKLSKPTTKASKIIKQTGSIQNSKGKNEKLPDSQPKMNEPMIRTLRSRKIDLSSSFNSSFENVTNVTCKSLRPRRINLSSSNYNSTLEGNTTNSYNKSQKTIIDKSVSQVNKNGRRPKVTNQTKVKFK